MELYDALVGIHGNVKRRFIYKSDISLWKVPEHWENYDQIPDVGTIVGDCDCFAMACRKECRKLNIPSRLIHCLTEDKVGHLVLSVDKWILDNRQKCPVEKTDLDDVYCWIKVSGYERGDKWHDIVG
jgi:predicted transglutaminase-like cysteine proteinase